MAEKDLNERIMIIKNEISELLDLNDKEALSYEDIKNIDKRKVLQLMQNVISDCAEGNLGRLKRYDGYMRTLNEVTDDYIDGLDDNYKKAYNFFVLNFIADTVRIYIKVNDGKNNFQDIISVGVFYKIIKELNIAGALTQSELADKLAMSTQCLSNYLKKIQDSNVFIKYKIPENKKQTFYTLSADCKKFINSENALPPTTKRQAVNKSADVGYWGERYTPGTRETDVRSYIGVQFSPYDYCRGEATPQEYDFEIRPTNPDNIWKKIKGEKICRYSIKKQ